MANRLVVRSLGCLVILLLLAGCGFKLRGSYALGDAFSESYLQSNGRVSAQLLESLKQGLTSSGSRVVAQRSEAGAIIILQAEKVDRRVLTVSSSAKVREYELYYGIDFEVQDAVGETLVRRQRVELRRDYLFDQNEVLAKDNEEAQVREEMVREAGQQILRRIQAVSRG
ncbi:MAG: LPS assembly lipoprotein LptE [Gammaproteobacteria bacterium]|nr:LPS assembly lipoprotein LptE [Gammaproteobacteria bacterium]